MTATLQQQTLRLVRILALILLALAVAAPAAAQIDLKKKLKKAAGGEKAQPAVATAGAETAGTLVLDDDVIGQMIKGLRAAKAHREAAAKGDTPYGRHLKAKTAYAEAKSKCDAGSQTLVARMSADPKLGDKNGRYVELMLAASEKGDTAAQRAWGDSMSALIDPACTVKDPPQPNDWYDQQRAVEDGAQQAELEASGFDPRESGQAKDRAIAIIQDAPPPDVSPSEQQAVKKQEKELKDLMGFNPPPEARAPKPAPAAAAAPPPSAGPTATPDQQAAADCMVKNSKKHEKELTRLGEKIQAASQANDMATVMALADSLQRLQTAGCNQ
jgi:hypothetical protein